MSLRRTDKERRSEEKSREEKQRETTSEMHPEREMHYVTVADMLPNFPTLWHKWLQE
jgi:hypothetical protein